MSLRDGDLRRPVLPALLDREAAALVERAAGDRPVKARHEAGDLGEAGAAATRLATRHRGQQAQRVGVCRPVEKVRHLPFLDDAAGIHHRHLVRHFRDDAEIVGDQQHGCAELALELLHQGQDLRLDGDIERGGGLVGDQQLGPATERHGDHHALAHAAGQLMRIGAQPARGIGDAHAVQHVARPLARRALPHILMQRDRLGDLEADGEGRVERAHRILEDHRHVLAAQRGQAAG